MGVAGDSFCEHNAILLTHRWKLYEFLWFEYAARKTRLTYCALKIVHAIDSNAYRSVAFTLRCESDRGFSLNHAIHIAAEFGTVIDHCNVIPGAKRVKEVAIQKRLIPGRS